MNRYITVFWFRRDLRISDNCGLSEALKLRKTTRAIFIFDKNILDELEPTDRRVSFVHEKVKEIRAEFNRKGSDLWVYYGEPIEVFEKMIRIHPIARVVANEDYEPYGIKRDKDIAKLCQKYDIKFNLYQDHVIHSPTSILKNNGSPYQVFTAYKNEWLRQFSEQQTAPFDTKENASYLQHCGIGPKEITLQKMGFEKVAHHIKDADLDQPGLKRYDQTRDIPSLNATTMLSAHLRFGTVSIRKVIHMALKTNETFLSELIWREFFIMILFHFPHTISQSFKPKYENIKWRQSESDFNKWCNGNTGYPIVDAAMHQLNETGYMHNRSRMIVASFLCKHLLIDWRWGEAYFAKKLNDFELSSNVGNWQWAVGSGCDAAPYFRIFNPTTQQQKFDSDEAYINRWNGNQNIPPIIEHQAARERCLKEYKSALSEV